MKLKINEKNITVKVNIPDNIAQVSADEAKIEQVLLNLIDNAIKYNKHNGCIIIDAVECNASSIRISIADTGIGISKEDLPRIFERFYRIDKARSRELGGTGLGLSIVKHIINAHNGEVYVTSEIDKGSTFNFILSHPIPCLQLRIDKQEKCI
ncbi:ATP-binding protein [Candidatus Poribacteria bacterium]|nr:ATP-binding protein [Candidatus Poribacteria bacterium]